MTDIVHNFSSLVSSACTSDMMADAVYGATGIDKNTLLVGAATVAAVGVGTALLFKFGCHKQFNPYLSMVTSGFKQKTSAPTPDVDVTNNDTNSGTPAANPDNDGTVSGETAATEDNSPRNKKLSA